MRVGSFASLFIVAYLLLPQVVAAQASVSVGTAQLKPTVGIEAGKGYVFEPVVVTNDGDQIGMFEMSVTFNETQVQHKPEAKWLEFSEQKFVLEPGQSKLVTVTLMVPITAQSGEYFAYIEAGTSSVTTETITRVSAVSASKLSFETIAATQVAEASSVSPSLSSQEHQPVWVVPARLTPQEGSKISEVLNSGILTNITPKSHIL